MAPLNILIVGSGICGPALACFLLLQPSQQKPHITILERSPKPYAHGQNIDIRGTGLTILRKLGLENAVKDATTGEVGVVWVDENDRPLNSIPAGPAAPTSDIEILRGRLAEILFLRSKALAEEVGASEDLEYIFGDYIEDLEQDGQRVRVRLAKSQATRTFDLVVGADGLHSRTRRMVFGEEGEADRVKRLGMYAGYFSMPKGETDSAWRRAFHAPGRRGVFIRPSDLKDRSTVIMYVIKETDERLAAVSTMGRSGLGAQRALLKEYFQDLGWECGRLIREMEVADDFYYDMVAQVKMETWSKGRVVLMGDAGYCSSPISGLGTTLALNGALHLAGALVNHPNDHTTAFAEYEEKMRPIATKAQKLVPGMPHLLNPETAWGIYFLHLFTSILLPLRSLIISIAGPPASAVAAPVEDYGFKQASEWRY